MTSKMGTSKINFSHAICTAIGINESALHNDCNPTSIVLDDPSCDGLPRKWQFATIDNTTINPDMTYSNDTAYSGISSCKLENLENITKGIMYQNITLPSG